MTDGFNPFDDAFEGSSNGTPLSSSSNDDFNSIWGDVDTSEADATGAEDMWEDVDPFSSPDHTSACADSRPQSPAFPATTGTTEVATTTSNVPSTNPTNVGTAKSSSKKKFGYKTVGLIIGGGLIGLAILIFIISRIKINKNPDRQSITPPNTTVEAPVPDTAYDGLWAFNPNEVALDYSGGSHVGYGVVSEKDMLKMSKDNINQVSCRLLISMDIGTDKVKLSYLCSKSTWDNIAVGTKLKISYYVPAAGYILIDGVTDDISE